MTDQNVESVPDLDLSRYLGLWFEIGRLPLKFEDAGARDITAEYRLADDGTVIVDNRCLDERGRPSQALGQAVPDPQHPGRLRVSFLPQLLRWIPFTRADYWVLRIDEHYRHALVGTPDHRFLWLLSRTPELPQDMQDDFLATAERQGFNLRDWISAHQSGRVVEL